jgi:hypothetical protein
MLLDITCKINDIPTRVILENNSLAVTIENKAWFTLQQAMIDVGYPTHECTCCLDPSRVSVEIIKVTQLTFIGWDAVNDMRRNITSRYRYVDVICKMEYDKLYACHELDYQDANPPWYLWTTGLNDDKWEKIE